MCNPRGWSLLMNMMKIIAKFIEMLQFPWTCHVDASTYLELLKNVLFGNLIEIFFNCCRISLELLWKCVEIF